MPKAAKKCYAVWVGRNGPRIYNSWQECNEQVSRFPGAVHRSFPSYQQAEEWLAILRARAQDTSSLVLELGKYPETSTSPEIIPPFNERTIERLEPPHPEPLSKIMLSPEQQTVLDRVKRGRSVFFTGSAGTGKSVLLREVIRFVKESGKELGITASTGIAAVNIGGCTLHSWAGIGLGEQDAMRYIGKFFGVEKFHTIRDRWQQVDTLIIDEISMIDGTLFDKLELIARALRKSDSPFGGIQLVLSGDFCQLPPVSRRGQQLMTKFAFEAEKWNDCVGLPVTLTRVFRQKDQAFVNMLNAVRFGEIDSNTAAAFGNLSRKVVYNDGIEPTELYPTRREVDSANSLRLKLLDTELHTYKASDFPGVDSGGNRVTLDQLDRILERLVVPKLIQLKVGAQVMLVKNLIQGELVNGSVGQVVRFSTTTEAQKDHVHIPNAGERRNPVHGWAWPVVRFIGGREMVCIPQEFTVNNADGSMEARRDQVPLILAWALSVHKSQGQTLERVKVDLRGTFEKGQAYVALSRATCLEQLQVLNFSPSKVVAHPRVIAWHFGEGRNAPSRRTEVIEIFDSDEEMDSETRTVYFEP